MTTTPEQFLHLLTASQEERDNAPCVPAGGQIILRRDLRLERAIETDWWNPDGSAHRAGSPHPMDCIATLDLASVLAELVGYRARIKELERGVLDGLSQWGQAIWPDRPALWDRHERGFQPYEPRALLERASQTPDALDVAGLFAPCS